MEFPQKPEQVDVLIAIDQKLKKQNEHLATIRSYVGWLLGLTLIPVITSAIGVCIYIAFVLGILNI